MKSSAIVSSLVPSSVGHRLYNPGEESESGTTSADKPTKSRLRNFLNDGETEKALKQSYKNGLSLQTRPIADLFTDTTVLFADIADFTAWSSVREPTLVFIFLETIYGAFDTIATRRQHADKVLDAMLYMGMEMVRMLALPIARRGRHRVTASGRKESEDIVSLLCKLHRCILGRMLIITNLCEVAKAEGLPPSEATRIRQWEEMVIESTGIFV